MNLILGQTYLGSTRVYLGAIGTDTGLPCAATPSSSVPPTYDCTTFNRAAPEVLREHTFPVYTPRLRIRCTLRVLRIRFLRWVHNLPFWT